MGKTNLAYEYLKKAIIQNEISPGAPLNEMELAARFGMSRSPIREALRSLETEGVVVIYPARGAFVTNMTPYDVEEIHDLRVLHELWALDRGFDYFTDAELDNLAKAFSDAYEARDWMVLHEADIRMHATIIEKSGNKRLIAFVNSLNTQIERIRRISARDMNRIEISYSEHLKIIELIKQKNLSACKKALRDHLRSVANSAIETSRMISVKEQMNK